MEDVREKFKKMFYVNKPKEIYVSNIVEEFSEEEKKEFEKELKEVKKRDYIEDIWEDDEEIEASRPLFKMTEVAWCPCCQKMSKTSLWIHKKRELKKDEERIFDYFLGSCSTGSYVFNKKTQEYDFVNNKEKIEFREEKPVLICPECKKDLTGMTYNILRTSEGWQPENSRFEYYNIVENDNKLIITLFFNSYFPLPKKGKLAVEQYNFKIVFNLKTGQSYLLEVRRSNGAKKKPKWCSMARIKNCTYNNCANFSLLNNILSNKGLIYHIGVELVKAKGGKLEDLFYPQEIEEINSGIENFHIESTWRNKTSNINFETLTIYNRLSRNTREFNDAVRKWLNEGSYWDIESKKTLRKKKDYLRKLSSFESEIELFNWLSKKYGIPNMKRIKKMVYKNPFTAMYYSFVKELGFTDYNIILDILENYTKELVDFEESYKNSNNFKNINDFLSDMFEKKTESLIRNMLFTGSEFNFRILSDTANMYETFKRFELVDNRLTKGTLREIHDRMAADYRKLGEKNIKIPYTEEMYELNDEIDDYKFELAKTTHQLITVGNDMGICVGSYGKRAAEGKLIIVTMTKNDKYVGCIELTKDGKELRQAKAMFNNVLQEKKAEALKAWVEKRQINTKYCYDYQHIANDEIEYDEDKIYQSTHNYAGYGNYNW